MARQHFRFGNPETLADMGWSGGPPEDYDGKKTLWPVKEGYPDDGDDTLGDQ